MKKSFTLSGNSTQCRVANRDQPCLISACCWVYISSCSSSVLLQFTRVDCLKENIHLALDRFLSSPTKYLWSFLFLSCSGTKVALLIDISVWLRAMMANRWLVVRVVLSSQWVWEVNILVMRSCLTSSGGRLLVRDRSADRGSSSTGMVLCHVGRNSDMWLALDKTPNEIGTWQYYN